MESLLERWLQEIDPCKSGPGLRAAACDRFRNPVEYALRENLSVLLENLTGAWRWEPVRAAIENIVQIRAVQASGAQESARFAAAARSLLHENATEEQRIEIDVRLQQIEQCAHEEYRRCLDRLAALRQNEIARRSFVSARRAQAAQRG